MRCRAAIPTIEPPFSFPLLRKLCPELNPALADLVSEALIYDVERRIRDVDEMRRRLLAIQRRRRDRGVGEAQAAVASRAQGARSSNCRSRHRRRAPAPSAPSAPTLLTVANEISCPACTRPIPGDSRFCSYCAADLRAHFGPRTRLTTPKRRPSR